MVEHAARYGTRFFRAGRSAIYAILPQSDREPSASSVEVLPSDAARWLFHEFLWDGAPVLEPYVSRTYPARLGFRYTAEGRAYRVRSRALRRQARAGPFAGA